MYELDVVGYAMPREEAQTTKLKLFDLVEVDEGLVKNGIEFDLFYATIRPAVPFFILKVTMRRVTDI